MSYYHSRAGQTRRARALTARAQRAQRFWMWFWCTVGATFLLVSLALAHQVGVQLVAGFLPHAHS